MIMPMESPEIKEKNFESEEEEYPLESEVLYINRVAKMLAGGRRFRFTALVAVGDKHGRVGLGLGKASEVVDAIKKGEMLAKKNLIKVYTKGTTIPYEVKEHTCSTTILLRPAREGSGITAGGPARVLLKLAGISDCTAKYFGSTNRINAAKAAFNALKRLEDPAQILYRRRKFHEWKEKQRRMQVSLKFAPSLLEKIKTQEEVLASVAETASSAQRVVKGERPPEDVETTDEVETTSLAGAETLEEVSAVDEDKERSLEEKKVPVDESEQNRSADAGTAQSDIIEEGGEVKDKEGSQ